MIHKLVVDKSIVIKFKEQQVVVASLPEHLQNEIATLDKLRQDKTDITYELEKIDLAIQFKMLLLQKSLSDHFEPKKLEDDVNGEDVAEK